MPATMSTSLLQILRWHSRMFFGVMCLAFLLLAAISLALPRQLSTVRTTVEVSSAQIGKRRVPFEWPDVTARRVVTVYAPAALSQLEAAGVAPSTIVGLQPPKIEVAGLSLTIINTVDMRIENEAKAFQQGVADQIIDAQASRVMARRKLLSERIVASKSTIDTINQQVRSITAEIENIDRASENLRNQVDQQAADLAKIKRDGSLEGAAIETRLHQLEINAAGTNRISDLSVERARLTSALSSYRLELIQNANSLAQTQSDLETITEARISLLPLSLPFGTSSRRGDLLVVAFIASILIAVASVLLLHSTAAARADLP